jgi:hypothetical protein
MSKTTTKIILGAVAVAALGLLARPAAAAEIGVGAAYWDTKDADEALGVATKVTFGRFWELRGTYFSDVTSNTSPEATDFEIRAIPLEAGLAFHFAPDAPISPYVGGGAGYYFLDTTEGQIDDEVGWYAVAGGDFGRLPSGMSFNVEAIYRNMEATVRNDPDSDLPNVDDDVHIDLSGLGFNAGVVWRF